jgi:DNA mismatch endonuclease (patch repair protein)
MRRITSKNTSPEMAVRRLVHSLGYRYRLHGANLPGRPDLVFRNRKRVIFVHGCFWHLHTKCREGRVPGSRTDYWGPKLLGNVARDKRRLSELRKLGWRVLTIWECEVTSPFLSKKVEKFLAAE